MRNQNRIPTTLHYAICRAGDRWVLTCEDIPVSCFDTRAAARRAAASYIMAARRRGDFPRLAKDDENSAAA